MKDIKYNFSNMDFDQYLREVPPSQKEKSKAWATAIGLQQVDGLFPSNYLYETARRNIEGEISIKEAKRLIDSYYESKVIRTADDENTEEADKVSARITEILADKSFSFTPNQLLWIHEKLFKDIFAKIDAGKFRTYNITKKEWVLDGDSVFYANADLIADTIKYDFDIERNFDYSKLSKDETIRHITRFIANIWQVHPFGEGNTRTTAVFTIKYLRYLGFYTSNDTFEKNSWYFRNALVRANYTNVEKNIYMNTDFLEKFFRNLILDEDNELKNRFTHIRYNEETSKSSEETSKSSEETPKSSEEILKLMRENPSITTKMLSENLSITTRAVEKHLSKLKKDGRIKRIGSTKSGIWEVVD